MRWLRLFLALAFVAPAWADDFNYSWEGTEWGTSWTDTAGTGSCDVTDTFAIHPSVGNPTNCRYRYCEGRNDTSNRTSVWTGTWEDLGVTPGYVVETIQMTDLDTKCLLFVVCDQLIFGNIELRDSADSLVATLWTGRTATAAEGSFTAEGSQSAQSVGSLTASDSNIEIWIDATGDTANDKNATCSGVYDNFDITIVANEAAEPTRGRVMVQ